MNYFNRLSKLPISSYTRLSMMLVRGWFFSLLGVKGSNLVFYGYNVQVVGSKSLMHLGKLSKIESNCIIQTSSKHGINIGNECTIGEYTMIRPSSYYGGSIGYGLHLGDRSAIGVMSYIGCSGKIIIGSDVIIGPHFTAIAENHNYMDTNTLIKLQGVSNKGIVIGNNVWIGCNVTILDGVTIGENSVIGAGSVVTKSFPSNCVIAGVPATIIKEIQP